KAVQRRHDKIEFIGNGLHTTEADVELLRDARHSGCFHVYDQSVKPLHQRSFVSGSRDFGGRNQNSATDNLSAEITAIFRTGCGVYDYVGENDAPDFQTANQGAGKTRGNQQLRVVAL